MRLIDQLDGEKICWEDFANQVRRLHEHRIGAPTPRTTGISPRNEENFYANPYPGCICEKPKGLTKYIRLLHRADIEV